MPCIHCLVEGRVQGVFYRASTQHEASRLNLVGWVKNCPDGKVELIACGDSNQLQEFKTWLWQGPQYAQVSNVECELVDVPDGQIESSFVIV